MATRTFCLLSGKIESPSSLQSFPISHISSITVVTFETIPKTGSSGTSSTSHKVLAKLFKKEGLNLKWYHLSFTALTMPLLIWRWSRELNFLVIFFTVALAPKSYGKPKQKWNLSDFCLNIAFLSLVFTKLQMCLKWRVFEKK